MRCRAFLPIQELLEVDHEVDTVERGLVCSSRFFRGAMVFGTMTLVAATIWSVRGNDAKAAHGDFGLFWLDSFGRIYSEEKYFFGKVATLFCFFLVGDDIQLHIHIGNLPDLFQVSA